MDKAIKTIGILVVICVGLTLLDIYVVETFYRPTAAWDKIWVYHRAYWALIIGLPVAATIVLKSLVPMGTWIFFIGGLEDTLFYGLQGYLPKIYWGVAVAGIWEPALNTVLAINIAAVAILVVYTVIMVKVDKWIQWDVLAVIKSVI